MRSLTNGFYRILDKSESAGYNVRFDRIDQNPEIFPFSYERKLPVSIKKTKAGGMLIWNGREYPLIPNQPQVINVIPQTNSLL